ncbi:hypothetical protein TREES_T100021202 [Tupaia chinensis]|uniref:Programmed cell death protein 5 n=1 Tax=Tupaia chinensis TaxID=246437 RepID=L8Y3G9_TUPCH|nr:hypothetical protein TREES_T100021202 [Tupaia chinensis]
MADEELEALRKQRLAELQAKHGARPLRGGALARNERARPQAVAPGAAAFLASRAKDSAGGLEAGFEASFSVFASTWRPGRAGGAGWCQCLEAWAAGRWVLATCKACLGLGPL